MTEQEYYDQMAKDWAEEEKAISCLDDKYDHDIDMALAGFQPDEPTGGMEL